MSALENFRDIVDVSYRNLQNSQNTISAFVLYIPKIHT